MVKIILSVLLTLGLVFSLISCENFPFGKKESQEPSAQKSLLKLSGVYKAVGTNPGGAGTYRGTATISREGDWYKIHWEVENVYDGIGQVEGNIFKVKWGRGGKEVGEVNYTINPDGVLRGTWFTYDNPGPLGTETLTPQKM